MLGFEEAEADDEFRWVISYSFCFLLFLYISSSDTCSDEKGVGDDVSCNCNNKTYLSSDKTITDAFSGWTT